MFEITLSLHLLKHNENCWRVAPRQHVNEGCRRERQCSNEGKQAMKSLSTEAADSAGSSARRTARAGARRENCILNGHSSTKVGLGPGGWHRTRQERTDPSDAGAGDACRAWHRRGACGQHRHGSDNVCGGSGWLRQSRRPDRISPALPAAYGDGGVSRS